MGAVGAIVLAAIHHKDFSSAGRKALIIGVIAGGIGTIIGPVVGAILIVPLENFLRGSLGGDIPGGHLIVLGAVMVIAALFLKRGIVGALVAAGRRFRGRR
jgi:branched-chain amino acid transport system permease protein